MESTLKGKAALVTGGANGIGLGIARALARRGVDVAIADIDVDRLPEAEASLQALGVRTLALPLDVSDRGAYAAAREAVERRLNSLSFLVLNAGIYLAKPVTTMTEADWDWLLGVNFHALRYGTDTFLPLLQAGDGPRHVLISASTASLMFLRERQNGPYTVSKFAALAYGEALRENLAGGPIGVSVLCPFRVNSTLPYTPERRPERFGGPTPAHIPDGMRAGMQAGHDPDAVGERAVAEMLAGAFLIMNDPTPLTWFDKHVAEITTGYASSGVSQPASA